MLWTRIMLSANLILLTPWIVFAWGPLGHRVAADMAEVRLTPSALSAIHSLLGPGLSLADVSTWADEQREVRGSARWHYVNVPISEPRYSSRFCASGECIVMKIEDFKRVLQNPGTAKSEKQQALKYLIHFIADIHQPLHVGDNNDRGGNLLQVLFFGTGSNLHRVWDSQVMVRHTTNEQVWLWDFDYLAKPKTAAEWSRGTPADWATESLQVAKEAYRLPGASNLMKSGTKLDDSYCAFALPAIQKQLAKAGIRMAWTLNEIFR